jgi:hypothetical protein
MGVSGGERPIVDARLDGDWMLMVGGPWGVARLGRKDESSGSVSVLSSASSERRPTARSVKVELLIRNLLSPILPLEEVLSR